MVLTTSSLAIRPVMVATAACQFPKPRGMKITAITLPTAASREASLSSTQPKPPSAKPKLLRNQRIMVDRRMMVPARLMKDQPRSHMERRTLLAEGAW